MVPANRKFITTPSAIRVLVIDDDEFFRRVAGRMLERKGYEVLSAESGETALDLAPKADVALVDMVMPGMSGIETIPLLRQRNSGLRVIASSGCAREYFRADLDHLGIAQFLSKPYPIEALVEKIEDLYAPHR